MAEGRKLRLGDLLREAGAISDEQLRTALAEQKRSGRKLGRVLVDLGFVSEAKLYELLSRHLNVPFIDLKQVRLDRETVRLLPEALARRFRALVLQRDSRGLLVGMADPTELHVYDELQARLRQPLRLALIGEAEFLKAIDTVYTHQEEIESLAEELHDELKSGDVDIEQLSADEGSPDAPVVRLLQTMFHDAAGARASDIHIEPCEAGLRIRLRIDGVLREQVIEGPRVAAALVTRLKLMCGLDIAERRLPQDGRLTIHVRDRGLDVRVATMPTVFGESVVMRLLDQSQTLLDIERLGMPEPMQRRFNALITRTAGMVLVTGPTGSGKTTTLYAALNHLNKPGVKIITVEDPVEYRLDRITQVQVNPKIGLDFGRVLRTALRQDPDVLLVGEMRDRETVEIGLRGAMTGHLVFSTLHTINAVATINRLLDMGAAGYMIASAVHGVVAQRLVRRLCPDCRTEASPSAQELAWLTAMGRRADGTRFYAPQGCTFCNLTGYRGRVAVYEMLEIDRALADVVRRGDIGAFTAQARARADYVPIASGAIDLAVAGTTSLAEAMAVSSGLEELGNAAPAAPLEAGSVAALLERRA